MNLYLHYKVKVFISDRQIFYTIFIYMYNVSTEIYEETASRLVRAARGEEFFSGSIVARDGEYDLRLTATVIVAYLTLLGAMTPRRRMIRPACLFHRRNGAATY